MLVTNVLGFQLRTLTLALAAKGFTLTEAIFLLLCLIFIKQEINVEPGGSATVDLKPKGGFVWILDPS